MADAVHPLSTPDARLCDDAVVVAVRHGKSEVAVPFRVAAATQLVGFEIEEPVNGSLSNCTGAAVLCGPH